MSKRTAVMRHMIADYLNVGTTEKAEYALMGTGFTTLDESPGAQTESVKYVNEKSSSSSVTGYETSFPLKLITSRRRKLLTLFTWLEEIIIPDPMQSLNM